MQPCVELEDEHEALPAASAPSRSCTPAAHLQTRLEARDAEELEEEALGRS